MVFNVNIGFINGIKDKFFPTVMSTLSSVPLPNQSSGPISTSNGEMSITNTNSDNVVMTFNPSQNSVSVVMTNTQVSVKTDWNFDESILSFSGSATANGPISSISMDIIFQT